MLGQPAAAATAAAAARCHTPNANGLQPLTIAEQVPGDEGQQHKVVAMSGKKASGCSMQNAAVGNRATWHFMCMTAAKQLSGRTSLAYLECCSTVKEDLQDQQADDGC